MSLYLTNFASSWATFDQYSTKLGNIWPTLIGHILTNFPGEKNFITEIAFKALTIFHFPGAVVMSGWQHSLLSRRFESRLRTRQKVCHLDCSWRCEATSSPVRWRHVCRMKASSFCARQKNFQRNKTDQATSGDQRSVEEEAAIRIKRLKVKVINFKTGFRTGFRTSSNRINSLIGFLMIQFWKLTSNGSGLFSASKSFFPKKEI